MKKIIALLLATAYTFTFAYTPSTKDSKTLETYKVAITSLKTKDAEKYDKVVNTLKNLDTSKLKDNKMTWLLTGLKDYFAPGSTAFVTTVKIEIVDGDTIHYGDLSIRMIWIDAPESNTSRYGYTECYWKEASAHLKELLKDAKEVTIEKDSTQWELDKYGRTLGYVIADGVNINEKMIEDGYAFEYTYDKAYAHLSDFTSAQLLAKVTSQWLWSSTTCNGDRKKGTPDEKKPETTTTSTPTTTTTTTTNNSSDRTYYTGPRGGCYYINGNGNKTYVDHSYCWR